MSLDIKNLITQHFSGGPGEGAYCSGASNIANIEGASIAAASVITITNHQKQTGDSVTISGDVRMTPTINGTYTITVTGANTFTIPVHTTADVGSGSWGSCAIGRITSLTGGSLMAIAAGGVTNTDTHIAMETWAWILERMWKLQQLSSVGTPSVTAIKKTSSRQINGTYSSGKSKYAQKFNYSADIYCDEDDINDQVINNVFDYF